MYQHDGFVNYPPPFMPSPSTSLGVVGSNFQKESSPSPSSSSSIISPAVLFVIVILSLLFFIAGLLYTLVRFLTKNQSSSPNGRNLEASTTDAHALQRQLQQLFNLHDSGLDQAFIDALPVFSYKEIVGPKEPLDCAVCLCGFSDTDQLRLLPVCSHAFHISCIDTWLLSNSTCPLCRGIPFDPDFAIENPIFDFDDFREEDGFSGYGEHISNTAVKRLEIEEFAQGNGVFCGYKEHISNTALKRLEIEEVAQGKEGVFPVRLGKFRKVDDEKGDVGDEMSCSKLDVRRCYSMGSYQYVVGDVNLSVSLSQDRSFQEHGGSLDDESTEGKTMSICTKTDSYSISKIWLWSKKGKFASSSDARLHNSHSPNMDLL